MGKHLGKQQPKKNKVQWQNRGKSAQAHMRAPPSRSSMRPSMSSTGWEQQGWALLGGAADRVTRSVPGTMASNCANKGNACCMAMSLASQRLLPLGSFTPSTSRQWDNAALVPSRSLPLCAAITNHACILATPRPLFGLRGVANSYALLFSPSSHTSFATFTATSLQGCGPAGNHA